MITITDDLTNIDITLDDDTLLLDCVLDNTRIITNGHMCDICNSISQNGTSINGQYLFGPYVEPQAQS